MIYISSFLVGLTALLLTLFVAQLVNGTPRALARRLSKLAQAKDPARKTKTLARPGISDRLSALLLRLGERAFGSPEERDDLRERLTQAGYRSPNAVTVYFSLRVLLSIGLVVVGVTIASISGSGILVVLMIVVWLGALGWLGPSFYLGRLSKAREREIQGALADTLDLLVVCVDAGLGLNQAWMRVAEEVRSVSAAMAEELSLVNYQIRAGVPRDEALRNLAKRTQSQDMRSLAGVLIQTDRFGTSVSQALRVQADSLRVKRRHRAEEAAAKTPVKLAFPLVFLILPALFVVIMGGAAIQVMRAFAQFN